MSKGKKIEGTAEAWETGALGSDEQYAKLSDLNIDSVVESTGLKTISLRMQPDLLEELKLIAGLNCIGYQPLIKQVLRRFVDAEMKMILREAYLRKERKQEKEAEAQDESLSDCA